MLRRLGVFAALCLGVCLGWTACFLLAFAQSKGVERNVEKMMTRNPIRATVD